MTLDQMLRDVGEHVDALIDRHLATTTHIDASAPTNERENELMTIVDQPPRVGESTARPRRHWALIAASAAAVVLLVAGIVAVRRDGDDEVADIPAPDALVTDATVKDGRIEKVVFDGSQLWSVRNGSTFLLRMNPTTGEVLESLSLPEAATAGRPLVHDGSLYVPTTHGIVLVDTRSRQIAQPLATGDGEVWSIAFTSDAVWTVRRQPDGATLERWNTALTVRELTIDLGAEPSVGLVGDGDSVYLATAEDGLRRYDANGTVTATVAGIGVAWEMEMGVDHTLWVADYSSGDLVAVDTTTNTIRTRVSISGNDVLNLAVTPSSVWVTMNTDQRLAVVDPATGKVTVSVALTGTPLALALAKGAVWVSGDGGWAERFVPG